MKIHIYDSSSKEFVLVDDQADLVYRAMGTSSDPRISSCLDCRSCVVATEPMSVLIDELSVINVNESDFLGNLAEYVENSESVHLYLQEENDCGHFLWRDPLAVEWSSITGEKRLHR
ncbi:MAG: hypothetical protein U0R17_02685 [Acidimicrobiia bacterium]